MFQKLNDMESKVDGVNAIAAQAELDANQAIAKADQAMVEAETSLCDATSGDGPAAQIDLELLQSLRGQPKEEAVINSFLNKVVDPNGMEGALDEMERYFESDLQKLGSSLCMLFAICCECVCKMY